jgi:hydrophobic/amphiphilic exporter-1 (mainly G- bacteria), HAE1 family
MKGVIRFSINNKFAIWIMTAIITFAGLYAGLNMKQETLPNLELPVLQMTAIYPGAAPEEVLEGITKPLEQRIVNLNGVEIVQSQSMENVAAIMLQFEFGKDMAEAEDEVEEAIQGVKLPPGVESPSVSRISLNAFPILSISASSDTLPLEELTKLVEDEIGPSFEGLRGVASVQVAGQFVKEAQLRFDYGRMSELGLSEEMVRGIIQGSSIKAPLGLFEMDGTEKTVVVDGNIVTLEQLKTLAIPVMPTGAGAGGGAMPAVPGEAAQPAAPAAPAAGIPTVELQEIADIELVGQAESLSRTNGQESISLQIVKAPDANTVDVANLVKEKAAAYAEDIEGLNLETMLDQGEPIEKSVETMLSKALFGALFAIVVILLFLRNIRTTLISIVSIPLSLLIAILLLKQNDITLNMMTLGAMTVAIGRVVDDSIVVIENIYRRITLSTEKLTGRELILEATREMFVPIASSTIVTIAVFVPLAAVSGMVGELFMPFALTMVYALLASLLVAITIVPMLGHLMFKNGMRGKQHDEDHQGRLAGFYKKTLRWSLNHKWITFGLAVLVLIGSMFLYPLVGVSFLPEEEQKYAMVTYTPAPGETIDAVKTAAMEAERLVLEYPDVDSLQFSVGGSGNPFSPGSTKSGLFYILFDNEIEQFEEKKEALVVLLQDKSGGQGEWGQLDMTGGIGGGNLSLNVYGPSYDAIKPAVQQIEAVLAQDERFEDIETSIAETYGQYTIVADQAKLSSLGLTAGQIAMKLSPVRERPVLTQVEVEGKSYSVYVEVDKKQYGSISEIQAETISSPLGIQVPIREIATVEEGESPNTITRQDGRMYASVSAKVAAADVGKASNDAQDAIDALGLPSAIDVEFGGVTEQINETFTQLGLAMLAAIAIVYLVLVITFGGGLAPFAILFSLPFTIIGAMLGLWIADETISVSAMMGALMLIGIVVTNAIVLIDRVIKKEQAGLSTREALLEAAGTRLRPILMTALATIGALLPLAFGFESAGIISRGLGVTVIGGLTSSTLLTLLIVPIVYEALMKLRRKRPGAEHA